MPFIYSDRYLKEFGEHIFPIEKYALIKAELVKNNIDESAFFEPQEATPGQLALVHTQAYLDDLNNLRLTERTKYSELPLTAGIVHLFYLAAGGTMKAMEVAETYKWCVHIGGGFHHASAAKAEGFCYINDLAVAARYYLQKKSSKRILIIDLDLHQGNGTAKICQADPNIFTFSMHEEGIYPVKEKSDLDIPLYAGTADDLYLRKLEGGIHTILQQFTPSFILYQAGADPYFEDQLGNLALTKNGLRQRDEIVLALAKRLKIPLLTTLGGGYAVDTFDTVDIHVATCLLHGETFS